ncbi:MAG: phosphatase PAP2 family protein, partial [Solirubrobacterales bacterium]
IVCAAALAWARRWTEVCVLLAGMVLIQLGFTEIKDWVGRPRPPDPLVDTHGSSFPSGHAAHSVIYVWLAFTIVLRLRPGMARAAAVVTAGIALTALVGLSRVYLGVHYLSDVSGGWALGAAAFSFCAAIGLVVSQVRQNPEPGPFSPWRGSTTSTCSTGSPRRSAWSSSSPSSSARR